MTNWDEEKMRGTEAGEADATLRLIAKLPAPEGLAERMRDGLRAGASRQNGRVLAWPVAARERFVWLRGAAAAAIVCVVSGGAWWISANVPAAGGSAVAAPVRVRSAGGFSNAGAMRTPDTVLKQGSEIRDQGSEKQGSEKQGQRDRGQGTSVPAGVTP